MTLEVAPGLVEPELTAIRRALAQAGVRLDGRPDGYLSAWSRQAAREAVDNQPAPSPAYARSPRSTRGATRA